MDRETRRQQMNISQQQRLDAETPDEKEEKLQQDMKLQKEQREVKSAIPMIQQPAAHSKMTALQHSKLAAVQILKCIVSFERSFQPSI